MRTLYVGLQGDDVRAWEHFLLGVNPSSDIIVDGVFTEQTKQETKKFQTSAGFTGASVDGVVGPATMGKAMSLGFDPMFDDRDSEEGPNWPPARGRVLAISERERLFGKFSYSATGPAEAIEIDPKWVSANIVTIEIPQLRGVGGAGKRMASFHKLAAPQVLKTFSDWEAAGLSSLVLTWGGAWSPRFIRGSRTTLSNHAWGTAFDINVQWNMLGTRPALKGQRGSVRELVNIACDNGLYWGGWYATRPDGMHFEVYKVTQ